MQLHAQLNGNPFIMTRPFFKANHNLTTHGIKSPF
jgi:hypothetical protein